MPVRQALPLRLEDLRRGLALGVEVRREPPLRPGEGQEVDASLLGGQLCIQSHNITYSWWSGKLPVRRPRHLPSATWNWYEASDGKWFTIGMNRQMYWPGICKVLGRPEWLEDERYETLESRLEHGDELYDAMQAIFHTRPRAEWIHAFAEADLAAIRAAGLKIGVSTHSHAELDAALVAAADYVALGPIYETKLKAMKWAPQGLARLAEWRARIGCPLVAIGGITLDRAPTVLAAGADSAAVVTDIVTSEHPDRQVENWIAATAPWRNLSTNHAQA